MADQKLPVVDEERIRMVFDELTEMDVQLDADPLQFGPKRMNGKVAEARTKLSRCERIFMQVSKDLRVYKKAHRAAELDFDLQRQYLFANDPEVRAGRNVADRDALATMKLRADRERVNDLSVAIEDLEMTLKVIRAKRADLRDIQGRLRDQKSLCEQEIGLGGKWGTRPPPGVEVPDLDDAPRTDKDALQRVQELLVESEEAGEVHLEPGDEEWIESEEPDAVEEDTVPEPPEDDEPEQTTGVSETEVDAILALVADAESGELAAEVDPEEAVLEDYPHVGFCGVEGCGEPVYETPSGTACPNGHGEAPVLDRDPNEPEPEPEVTPEVSAADPKVLQGATSADDFEAALAMATQEDGDFVNLTPTTGTEGVAVVGSDVLDLGGGETNIAAEEVVEVAPEEPPKCPKCGVGVDTDGDGDCPHCAHLIDETDPDPGIDVDALFDDDDSGDKKGVEDAMPAVTTDAEVDHLFAQLDAAPAPSRSKKKEPPADLGTEDLDSLIDMFGESS